MSKHNFLLIIEEDAEYDTLLLRERLDNCLDWSRLFANTYILHTTSDREKLFNRFKPILGNSSFFIAEIELQKNNYTGWLKQSTWDRIKEFKTKE